MRKILFLDFDGVLNNTTFYERRAAARKAARETPDLAKPYNHQDDFDPENLAQLADLMKRVPDLEIVVSSTWRKGRSLDELRDLIAHGFPRERVVGNTGQDPDRLRWKEIKAWLQGKSVADYLAFDDDRFDMVQLGEFFHHVDRKHGLTAAHVERAVAHFERSPVSETSRE